jgi:hypothetical protein
MRAYVITSGLVFLALALAHVARLIIEGTGPLHEIGFVAASVIAITMAAWAGLSVRSRRL